MDQSKSLGRSSSRLLIALAENDRNVFSFRDAVGILKSNDAATRKLMSDLVKRKWIIQLSRGRYLVVPLSAGEKAEVSENWYVIAKYLVQPRPYYISHYSAMEIHRMTTQPISTVFVSAPHRKKDVLALGATFHFVSLVPSRMWGTTGEWATSTERVEVSDLERTIVDSLNNPRLCGGVSEIAKGIHARKGDIDYVKLLEYIERFGSNAVAKRLGFLMELYGMNNETVERLRRVSNLSYVLLDPSLPAMGRHWHRWRLRLNVNPEELKEIVTAVNK
ncbi:MAG: hypothetical protein KKE43_07625 [Actinobacteria bacterium]|nr:hypothetical protein [Actinomycetota bacterium]